jgi:four helix bundle protein
VHRCTVTFLGVASTLAERVTRGHSALADQLRRAALSVPLNIAEGSGKGTMEDREARRFYAIARGSALECAAIVDALEAPRFVLGDEAIYRQGLTWFGFLHHLPTIRRKRNSCIRQMLERVSG